MAHRGLQARMMVAGGIVFGFYAVLAAFFRTFLSLEVVLAGSVLFVGVQWVLAKKLALRGVNARELDPEEHPELAAMVADLSAEMDIPTPTVYLGRMGVPNAFALGRRSAGSVVLSESLLELLDRDELEGVVAHELAHIRNRDSVVMLLGQSVATMISMTVYWLIVLADDTPVVGWLVAWILSSLVHMAVSVFVMAISRYREYVADSTAAEATGDPEALARGLAKIVEVGRHEDAPDVGDSVSAMCIFGGKRGLLDVLFASHPAPEKRIARLDPSLLEEA